MIVIVVLDDKNGMTFNHRRQSQDAVLRQRILELSNGSKLWMNAYSYKLFSTDGVSHINVADDFLLKAKTGEYCFVENVPLAEYSELIEKIIAFRWNRQYPSDTKFDIPLDNWKLYSSCDFVGKSHAKITEEIYVQ